jgi:hypothetical protein
LYDSEINLPEEVQINIIGEEASIYLNGSSSKMEGLVLERNLGRIDLVNPESVG